jgi:hypothetical protein
MIGTLPDINYAELAQWIVIFILMSRATRNEKSLASILGFFVKLEKTIKKDREKINAQN